MSLSTSTDYFASRAAEEWASAWQRKTNESLQRMQTWRRDTND